jgi:hypothetical protein
MKQHPEQHRETITLRTAHRARKRMTRKDELALAGLNTVDMKDDGSRWCLFQTYGQAYGPDAWKTLTAIMQAWGVVEPYLAGRAR